MDTEILRKVLEHAAPKLGPKTPADRARFYASLNAIFSALEEEKKKEKANERK